MKKARVITKKELFNKIAKLTKLAIFINAETDVDVFIDFSGHIDKFDIHYYLHGWANKKSCKRNAEIDTYLYNDYTTYRGLMYDGYDTDQEKYHNGERSIDIIMRELETMEKKLLKIVRQKDLDLSTIGEENE